MQHKLEITDNIVWRESGFLIVQERDRESDDTTQLSNLFTFTDLNPEVSFSNRFTRRERIKLGWYFIKQAIFANA